MKVVILAGGFGTRLSEYTEEIPKPMVMIGSKPILWHVMSCYANHGFKEFVVALGYKAEVIKDYLSNFENKFIGITGEPEKIFLLYKSWGIMSKKIFLENGEYNIDHSSPVIILKDGKYVAMISHRDDIKQSIKILKKYL